MLRELYFSLTFWLGRARKMDFLFSSGFLLLPFGLCWLVGMHPQNCFMYTIYMAFAHNIDFYHLSDVSLVDAARHTIPARILRSHRHVQTFRII